MCKVIFVLILSLLPTVINAQIIADHTVVDRFDDIPVEYLTEVKKMWVSYAGESHALGCREGMKLLEAVYPAYPVSVVESGTPEPYTAANLRFSGATWGDVAHETGWQYSYGEEDWWTNPRGISRTKAGIAYCNTNGFDLAVIGFGWCWDMIYGTASSGVDPVYGCHWYGISQGGIDGEISWGIDDEDNTATGNSVNLEDYLRTTQEYIGYCKDNGYPTKIFFTTGPVDRYYTGESGYQGFLKHERIREFVKEDTTRILFDYADILCYDDDGRQATITWNGHTFESITPTNLGSGNVGHISQAGAIRLAKAMWWMLARMAGWDGNTGPVYVSEIIVTGAGGSSVINADNGTLQLNSEVRPRNATDKTVTWSIQDGTGHATISASGLVTALTNGTVIARATANDGSGTYGTLNITISNQINFVPVSTIIVTGTNGLSVIDKPGGTLQLLAEARPSNATDKTVNWSIQDGTGHATISSSGLVTAVRNGTAVARATANDGSGTYGTLNITISNQINFVPVSTIIVTGTNGLSVIDKPGGTLQLLAEARPSNATDKTVTWSIADGTGHATISSSGLVTAGRNGTAIARATANDGSGIYGTLTITISNQISFVPVSSIIITGADGQSAIDEPGESLQLIASVFPANATNQKVYWSISDITGHAIIDETGRVTAVKDGSVVAKATASDGTGIFGTLVITISGQITFIPVTEIILTAGQGTTLMSVDETLQIFADVRPSDASDTSVSWSILEGTALGEINELGLLSAHTNGTITIEAIANDGSGVKSTIVITVLEKEDYTFAVTIVQRELRVTLDQKFIDFVISIYDLNGQLIETRKVNSDLFVTDLSACRSGLYLIVLSDSNILIVNKFVLP